VNNTQTSSSAKGLGTSLAHPLNIVDGTFSLGTENFVIDVSANNRRPSDAKAFTLVKTKEFLSVYCDLASTFRPKGILELGVFQGGSYVFLDQLMKPERMSAVELSQPPIAPLVDYIDRTSGRSVHFGTSQTDEDSLRRIVRDDLDGRLDLVVDDASHHYDYSKKSFEILFPLLAEGGYYVIEDWAWAHQAGNQRDDAPWRDRPALTNLLFEQIVLMGSTGKISEIRITKPLYIIRKSSAEVRVNGVWDGMKARDRAIPLI
jgi:predicted O-methyltransferase YrrM